MAFQGDSIFWVEVEKIVPNPFQPRREFDDAKLTELSESIRMYGILQPLTVTRKEIQSEDGAFYTEYELIAGERRLRASKLAGLAQVPVIIRSGEDTEQEKLELAIIENLQREDLNAVDRAIAFKQLAETFELSHGQVAKKVGRSREYVSNSIRLLQLPECMQNSLKLGDISEGHARTLLMLKDRPEEQDVVYREILLKKLSVREVERITRKIASDKVRKKKWTDTDAELIAIEKEFTDTLGTRVQISKTEFGGKLTIDYFSDEDLQKLLLLMKQEEDSKQEALAQEEESTTVIHEMSPEASLMAKLSQATPLTPVTDEAQTIDMTSESSDVFETESEPETSAYSHVPQDIPREDSIVPPVLEEKHDKVNTPVPETVIEEPRHSIPMYEAPQENVPVTPSAEPILTSEVSPVTPTPEEQGHVAQSSEFNFIAQHGEAAIKPDLENPYQEPESLAAEVQPIEPTHDEKTIVQDAEDEDLYSMKNFSV